MGFNPDYEVVFDADGKIIKTQLPDSSASAVQVDVFATAQAATAWLKPAGAKYIEIELSAGGAGGGSGRRGAAASVRSGGAGGGAGGHGRLQFAAADVPSTVYVWVGAGGAGGAAQTVDSTNGTAGTAGGKSYVTTSSSAADATAILFAILFATSGDIGEGGTTAAGTAVNNNGYGPDGPIPGSGGQRRVAGGLANDGYNGGGGAGASLSAADGQVPAGRAYASGASNALLAPPISIVVAGTTAGTNGPDASSIPFAGTMGGAGGNYGSASVAGGRGGHGKNGGGGGGGGAGVNGANSGAGGNGGTGYVRFTTHF